MSRAPPRWGRGRRKVRRVGQRKSEVVRVSAPDSFTVTDHSHGLGAEDLGHVERGVEGDVGHHVEDGDEEAGEDDGPGEVSHGVLHLLDDKVEVVPAVVGKEAGVEGEGDLGQVRLRLLPGEVFSLEKKTEKKKTEKKTSEKKTTKKKTTEKKTSELEDPAIPDLAIAQLDESCHDDDEECEQFGVGKDILRRDG